MTVRHGENGVIELVGRCDSSDAEVLQSRLLAFKGATVDWRHCDTAHTAVLQVMLAAGVVPIGPPRGKFLIDMLEPLLKWR
jgi:hypothetical protein